VCVTTARRWSPLPASRPPKPIQPVLTIPIRQGGTELRRIECGPRRDGNPLLEEDRRLLGYPAGQAEAAVHNLYLTTELPPGCA
jgi:GAF domain-containing protein